LSLKNPNARILIIPIISEDAVTTPIPNLVVLGRYVNKLVIFTGNIPPQKNIIKYNKEMERKVFLLSV
jgi:hypothetical protein